MHRWIMYIQQNIPGNLSFDVHRVDSLADAREQFAEYCAAVGSDECSATLYAYSDDAWKSAEEFREIGCPLDCPDRIIERGPRNGIVVNRA